MTSSVSALAGFDCSDFQDFASVGEGGGYQPTTVVPSHFQMRSYGPVLHHTLVQCEHLYGPSRKQISKSKA